MIRRDVHSQAGRMLSTLTSKTVGKDIPISVLYDAVFDDGYDVTKHRQHQQKVGRLISRVKGDLIEYGLEVVPGTMKRTYRLRLIGG